MRPALVTARLRFSSLNMAWLGLAFSIFAVLKFSFLKISVSLLLFVVVKIIVSYIKGFAFLPKHRYGGRVKAQSGVMVNSKASKAHSKRISDENTFCFDLKGR